MVEQSREFLAGVDGADEDALCSGRLADGCCAFVGRDGVLIADEALVHVLFEHLRERQGVRDETVGVRTTGPDNEDLVPLRFKFGRAHRDGVGDPRRLVRRMPFVAVGVDEVGSTPIVLLSR
ncbi:MULTISPECIES: hypothetical protein [Streptomyces]|uniref:Uncharacterized protein n=1 Tax=Streptomyces mordarskii TaxID=1226758 RepID=A0ABP3N076_9ACTN|nr:hypothetical protein [Streptomyces sp. AgN23]QTI87391.1 hypothetical protein AS97_40850 [Streptomyces sp. AgN23]WTB10962.1 hypothetical protein OG546_46670 [Streptomyces antimycoticus]